MEVLGFLAPWVLLGVAVLFLALSGGGRPRQAPPRRAGWALRVLVPFVYVGVGVIVPALVIAGRGEAVGGTARLAGVQAPEEIQRGKELFRQTCASCHTLAAANARGVTGPSLDQLGAMTSERVLGAIRLGGTGKGRMPTDLVRGGNAEAVAAFVERVAGK